MAQNSAEKTPEVWLPELAPTVNKESLATLAEVLGRKTENDTRRALFMAIELHSLPIVKKILTIMSAANWSTMSGCSNDVIYASHVTPLVMACLENDLPIVQWLMHRGTCYSCKTSTESPTKLAIERLDMYRAQCSPAFLWLAGHDPVLYACRMVNDLRKSANEEPLFETTYLALESSVVSFVADVTACCETSADVGALLTRREGTLVNDRGRLPRVQMALDSHMTTMLTNDKVQAYLYGHWRGNWAESSTWNMIKHTVGYPVTSVAYICSGGQWPKSYNIPFARYVSYSASYFTFLGAMFLATQIYDDTYDRRGWAEDGVEIAIYAYIWLYSLGMASADIQKFAQRGFSKYFDVWWHWFDAVLGMFLVNALVCMLRADNVATIEGVRHSDRVHWTYWDAQLLYEGAMATACILSYWRVFYFIQLNHSIGPTVVAIGRCLNSIVHFVIIVAIVMVAFALSINFLWQPYFHRKATDEWGIEWGTTHKFPNTARSLSQLYWAIYGYLHPYETEISVGMVGPQGEQEANWHFATQITGELLCALYYLVVVVILLNLMVAFLVAVADRVQAHADVEWRSTRCHVWAEFDTENMSVPPPFNIIAMMVKLVRTVIKYRKLKDVFGAHEAATGLTTDEEERDYANFMLKMYTRYTQHAFKSPPNMTDKEVIFGSNIIEISRAKKSS